MRINAITQPLQAEFQKTENAKRSEKTIVRAKAFPTDNSMISEGAKRLSDTKASIDSITGIIKNQDDIRTDKISEVIEKIKNGYYDSPEFIDKLAVKLLAEFGIKPPE